MNISLRVMSPSWFPPARPVPGRYAAARRVAALGVLGLAVGGSLAQAQPLGAAAASAPAMSAAPVAAAAAPGAPFTGYPAFYESLGGNLFPGDGVPLAQACTDTPRRCLWVNAMTVAVRRYSAPQWIAPGELDMDPPKGTPGIGFDGQSLSIGERRWRLAQGTDLAATGPGRAASATESGKGAAAKASRPAIAAIDPENLAQVAVWRRAGWACVELHFNASGRGGRYPQVLVAQGSRLFALPRLFSACAAVREAPGQGFSYPVNTYLGAGGEAEPDGLQVDYLLPDGQTRVGQYRLRYLQPDNVYLFEVVPQDRPR